MDREHRNLEALVHASANAERAIGAFRSPDYANVPREQKQAWAMATLIHCDLTRLVVALDRANGSTANLLWMADLAAKIYEAKRWYLNQGGPLLIVVSEENRYGSDAVRARIRELKNAHGVSAVERLAIYRNKVSYHYDNLTLEHLERFEQENAEAFFKVVEDFVRFSIGWAHLTKEILTYAQSTAKA